MRFSMYKVWMRLVLVVSVVGSVAGRLLKYYWPLIFAGAAIITGIGAIIAAVAGGSLLVGGLWGLGVSAVLALGVLGYFAIAVLNSD
jgi:hypothetical protein